MKRKLVQTLYELYLEQFNKIIDEDLFSKKYDITLFRGLFMYFLYQINRKGIKVTLSDIAEIMRLKSHSTVIHHIEKIGVYIQDPLRVNKKYRHKFVYLTYVFNKTLNKTKK